MFGGIKFGGFLRGLHFAVLAVAALAGLLALASWLRQLDFLLGIVPFYYLQIVASLLSLIYAAHATVRFRGTHDRLNLTLAFGFALVGLISTISVLAASLIGPVSNNTPAFPPAMAALISSSRGLCFPCSESLSSPGVGSVPSA